MRRHNIILLSVEETRPDHLSCYGYQRIRTRNIDSVSKEGVLFETCIAPDALTPIVMSSVMSATYPNKHTVRDPFGYLQSKTIAGILKDYGYQTAGFVGIGLLGSKHGFNIGFDHFDEPTSDTAWGIHTGWTEHQDQGDKVQVYEGNWWVDRMLEWLKQNCSSNFFIWGHYFETHEGAQKKLLERGLIKEGELPEFGYYDAKIKLMDEKLMGSVIKALEKLNISENTTLVLMADHGTNLGDRPAKPLPWREKITYPQHTTLYDHDLKVWLIMKSRVLPKNKRIKGMVRSIDVVPTLLELCGIPLKNFDFDGESLLPVIKKGRAARRTAYAEDLYEDRGPGALQAFRTETYKFIRNLTKDTEEFYDLVNDSLEKNNIIRQVKESQEETLVETRKQLNALLWKTKESRVVLSKEDKEEVKARLRALGYIE